MHRLARRIVAAFVGMSLLASSTAYAGFIEISISDNLGHSLTVSDNMAGDSNPLAGAISVDAALLVVFPNLNSMSNVTATLSESAVTILSASGNLFGNTNARFTINSSANNLVLPSAPGFRHETSTETFLFAGGSAGASGTTQDGVHTANVLHGQNILNVPFTYVSTGFASNSGSSPMSSGFDFNNGNSAYALTSITGIDVQSANALSQYQANLVVTAGPAITSPAPEPTSLALLVAAVPGMLLARRRRN